MSQPHTVSLSWLMLIYCDLLTKNLTCGAAVIGRSVKCLPWKKKDLRVLRIQLNKEKLGMTSYTCNPSPGEVETGWYLGVQHTHTPLMYVLWPCGLCMWHLLDILAFLRLVLTSILYFRYCYGVGRHSYISPNLQNMTLFRSRIFFLWR